METYESPKCEVMELLSEGPLLRPSLGDMGDGDDGHIPEEGDGFMVRIIKCIFMKPFLLWSVALLIGATSCTDQIIQNEKSRSVRLN